MVTIVTSPVTSQTDLFRRIFSDGSFLANGRRGGYTADHEFVPSRLFVVATVVWLFGGGFGKVDDEDENSGKFVRRGVADGGFHRLCAVDCRRAAAATSTKGVAGAGDPQCLAGAAGAPGFPPAGGMANSPPSSSAADRGWA